ncbi:MAG: cation transporter [Clostridiales bacterium]|nr:cation transporter [Clostridiales bacterium]
MFENLLIKLFVKDRDNVTNPEVRQRYGVLAGIVGICCNIMLSAVKLIVGLISHSVSIAGDAVNNLSDSVSSVITLVSFRLSGKRADREQPYGHGRIEYVSGFIVAAAVIAVALELLKTSVNSIIHGSSLDVSIYTIIILVCTIAVKMWMSHFYIKVSRKIDSAAMMATAKDSMADCMTTGVALISVIVKLTADINIDGYAGAAVALLVIWSGITSARETIELILGEAPSEETVGKITDMALSHPEIKKVHDLRIHDYGPGRTFASLHVEMPYEIGFIKAHEVVDLLEQEIMDAGIVGEITIHMDPIINDDDEINYLKEQTIIMASKIDPEITVHDFRLIRGQNENRIIFELTVPYDLPIDDSEIVDRLTTDIHSLRGKDCGDSIRIIVDRG